MIVYIVHENYEPNIVAVYENEKHAKIHARLADLSYTEKIVKTDILENEDE